MVQAGDDAVAVSQQDLPQALQLLAEMGESADKVSKLVDSMLLRVKRGEISTAKGLSFLEVKYHTLLSYLINLSYVVLRKSSGVSIFNDPSIDRLVELRTVLERLRPIDRRLKYQIDKLVKTAVTGECSDASSFRANPDNMVSKLEGDSDSSEDEEGERERKSVYVPPKLAPMHYEGDETAASRQEKLLERAKRRALSSSMVRELREEYLDAPTELGSRVDSGAGPSGPSKEDLERQEYEETYFTRLPVAKEKRKKRKLPTMGSLADELINFGSDFRGLEGEVTPKRAKKRGSKTPSKKKGSKGFKKRKSR
ncbi:neuroguidin [Neocloeon triangulifer]|uniref:neuroguidin n=1 Tax=Neocloeon triangulifer TaxID=2078957 RepID=UPI00286EDB0A|nr:neuroguidin [Neocloeon triangulifer]